MPPSDERKSHDAIQSQYFNERANFFCQPIPADIEERTAQIVAAAQLNSHCHVLDVGCGTGVLFPHFKNAGVKEENITGCDLSFQMLEKAADKNPSAKFFHGDILDFPSGNNQFDAVFFNACFGNIYDQQAAIRKALSVLEPAGRIVISHPLGAKFVQGLHENEPEIVPHLLPSKELLSSWQSELGLSMTAFTNTDLCYIAVLQRTGESI